MGSLFVIVIPIRTHELKLRLIENDLLNNLAVHVKAPEGSGEEEIVEVMKVAMDGNHPEEEQGIPAKDIVLPATKQAVQAYSLTSKKGQLLLQLTRDTMKLNQAGPEAHSVPEAEHVKLHRGSSESMDLELDTTSVHSLELKKRGSTSTTDSFETGLIELIDSQFLEKHAEDVLTEFSLLNAAWDTSIDGKFSRIIFTVSEAKADTIINHVHALGIGKKYESTLSVCATTVFTQEKTTGPRPSSSSETDLGEKKDKADKWRSFKESIKARLTVAQVVQNVKANAVLTFDFIVMLIVAAIIATLGLLESSSVNLIASMLVSPLMGPIMAFTFGAMIRDVSLIKTGATVELLGLMICLLVGFVFGIFLEWQPISGPWSKVTIWPTTEMRGRGQVMSLLIGAAVAIPSGAGVALSILAGNAGSLVGVAISASLLPPCVNSGIFYGIALVIAIHETSHGRDPFKVSCHEKIGVANETPVSINHQTLYCENVLMEFALMGTVSLGLTLLNIVLIFVTGIICLKIKEVAPYTTKTAFERFWKHDLKHARDYNKTHMGQDTLIHDLVDDPNLLDEVGDDYVFNQIKNRAMYRDENVIANVKNTLSKTAMGTMGSAATGNWIGALFSKSKPQVPGDVEVKKSTRADVRADPSKKAHANYKNEKDANAPAAAVKQALGNQGKKPAPAQPRKTSGGGKK